jgi:hypothetical protein
MLQNHKIDMDIDMILTFTFVFVFTSMFMFIMCKFMFVMYEVMSIIYEFMLIMSSYHIALTAFDDCCPPRVMSSCQMGDASGLVMSGLESGRSCKVRRSPGYSREDLMVLERKKKMQKLLSNQYRAEKVK